jgi:hypothetical protein
MINTLNELKPGTLSEPVELTGSELDIVAGGKATALVKLSTKARARSGEDDTAVAVVGGAFFAVAAVR